MEDSSQRIDFDLFFVFAFHKANMNINTPEIRNLRSLNYCEQTIMRMFLLRKLFVITNNYLISNSTYYIVIGRVTKQLFLIKLKAENVLVNQSENDFSLDKNIIKDFRLNKNIIRLQP